MMGEKAGATQEPLSRYSKRHRMTIHPGDYICPVDDGIVDAEYCDQAGAGKGCNRKGKCHAYQHPELNKPKEE